MPGRFFWLCFVEPENVCQRVHRQFVHDYDEVWHSVCHCKSSPTQSIKHDLPMPVQTPCLWPPWRSLIDLCHRSFGGRVVVAAAVVTGQISRITDNLSACLTKTSQPDCFLFRYLHRSPAPCQTNCDRYGGVIGEQYHIYSASLTWSRSEWFKLFEEEEEGVRAKKQGQ